MVKIVELFAGIGAIRKAFINTDIPFKVLGVLENDPSAVKIYNALYPADDFKLHNVNCDIKAAGEILKNHPFFTLPFKNTHQFGELDLVFGGSPCQDFSIIGKNKGGGLGSGTRSSLMGEQYEFIKLTMPKVAIGENVANVLSTTHRSTFLKYGQAISALGYHNIMLVLNACNFGIPQKRKRVFLISLRNDFYTQNLEKKFYALENFKISHQPLKAFLQECDDIGYFVKVKTPQKSIIPDDVKKGKMGMSDIHPTFQAEQIVYNLENDTLINTITATGAGSRIKILQNYFYNKKITPQTNTNKVLIDLQNKELLIVQYKNQLFNVRRLTELECWLLMGFSKTDFLKASKVASRAQLYKTAGNSIVVPVLEEIIKILGKEK